MAPSLPATSRKLHCRLVASSLSSLVWGEVIHCLVTLGISVFSSYLSHLLLRIAQLLTLSSKLIIIKGGLSFQRKIVNWGLELASYDTDQAPSYLLAVEC